MYDDDLLIKTRSSRRNTVLCHDSLILLLLIIILPSVSQDLLQLLPGAQSFLIRTRWALWRVRSLIPDL
jgi:hypothetical protein